MGAVMADLSFSNDGISKRTAEPSRIDDGIERRRVELRSLMGVVMIL